MSDFLQQLFETLQIDIAEETSEAMGTGLSFTVVILLALAAYILTRFILLRILVRFYARTKSKAGEILLQRKVFQRLTLLVPAVVLYLLAPLALEGYAQALSLVSWILGTYAIIIIVPTINAALNALNVYYETLEVSKTFPITSIVQVVKVVAFVFVGTIAASFLFDIPAVHVLAAIGALAVAGTVVFIDMHTIQGCTDEMLDALSSMPYVAEYVDQKRQELAKSDADRFITNLGLFRAYVRGYLQHHPKILPEMPLRVYQEEPTRHGLPIQILAFCSETEITPFEEVQSDVFDHILAVVPEFELRVRQAL